MNQGQSRTSSLVESLANILIGFAIAFVSQLLIFKLYSIQLPLSINLEITLWFTLVSLARSYTLRRFFNWIHLRGALDE